MITTKLKEIRGTLLNEFPFFEKGMIVNSLDANTWIDELKYYFYLKVIQSRDARTYRFRDASNALPCGWAFVQAEVRLIAQIECSNPDIALAKLVGVIQGEGELIAADNNSEQIYTNETGEKYLRELQLFQVDFRLNVPVNFECSDEIICEPCCEDESI